MTPDKQFRMLNSKNKLFLLSFFFVFSLFTACNSKKEPSVSIDALPTEIPYGATSAVTWQSSNADYCMLNGEKVEASGSLTKTLTETTKYTITAYGEETTANAEVTVIVGVAATPKITVTAPKEQLPYGSLAIFSWIAEGFINTISLDGNPVQNSGSYQTPALYGNAEYVLVAIGPGGTTTQKIPILVYIPTAADTLCSGSWTETLMKISLDNGISWGDEIPPEKYDKIKIFFYPDHKYVSYLYPYTGEKWENTVWRIEGRNLIYGQGEGILYSFILKDDKLTLFFIGQGVDKNGNVFPVIHKTVYTKDK